MIEQLLTLDGNILLWIQDHVRAEWLTPIVKMITKLGGLGFMLDCAVPFSAVF